MAVSGYGKTGLNTHKCVVQMNLTLLSYLIWLVGWFIGISNLIILFKVKISLFIYNFIVSSFNDNHEKKKIQSSSNYSW